MPDDADRRYRWLMLAATGLWVLYVLLVLAIDTSLRQAGTVDPASRRVTIHATR